MELEDVSDKNESAEIEYVRDDANATWRLSTMDPEVSVFSSEVDQTTRRVLSSAHNNEKLWLKRQGDSKFRNTREYEMVPEATEASLRAASTHDAQYSVEGRDVPVDRGPCRARPRFVNVKLRDSSESMRAMLPEELGPGGFRRNRARPLRRGAKRRHRRRRLPVATSASIVDQPGSLAEGAEGDCATRRHRTRRARGRRCPRSRSEEDDHAMAWLQRKAGRRSDGRSRAAASTCPQSRR